MNPFPDGGSRGADRTFGGRGAGVGVVVPVTVLVDSISIESKEAAWDVNTAMPWRLTTDREKNRSCGFFDLRRAIMIFYFCPSLIIMPL